MRKKLFGLFLIMGISLFTFGNVYALEIVESGDSVIQEGIYDSTRLVAGNKITSSATVDGISFIAGNEIVLTGTSTYGVYAGNTLSIQERVEKDLFVAGNGVNLLDDAYIGRDAYIAGNVVKVDGTIGRNLNVGAASVNLGGATVNGDAYISADVIVLDEKTVITGKLTYDKDASISGLDTATVGSVKTKNIRKEANITYNPMTRVYDFIISTIAAFIVMMVLFYIIPRSKERLDELKFDGNTIFITLVIGLAVLFLTPIIAIIGLFTGFLTSLSLILLCVYGVSIYLAYLLSYYVIGNLLTTKLIKKDNVYLALIIGILGVKLICYIPILGGFVSLICLLYGLGLIFNFIKSRGK